jgi:hypothetical protein
MVLAHGIKGDVLERHDLVVFLGEGGLHVAGGIVVKPGEQLGVHPGDARRRVAKTFALRVFADGEQNLATARPGWMRRAASRNGES